MARAVFSVIDIDEIRHNAEAILAEAHAVAERNRAVIPMQNIDKIKVADTSVRLALMKCRRELCALNKLIYEACDARA